MIRCLPGPGQLTCHPCVDPRIRSSDIDVLENSPQAGPLSGWIGPQSVPVRCRKGRHMSLRRTGTIVAVAALAAGTVLGTASLAGAAVGITNGGFETGTLSGWT